jgi:hypothetical protein
MVVGGTRATSSDTRSEENAYPNWAELAMLQQPNVGLQNCCPAPIARGSGGANQACPLPTKGNLMKLRMPSIFRAAAPLIVGAAVAAMVFGTALPASAAITGDTTATFTLSGGSLDVSSLTAAPAALTAGASGTTAIFGSLGLVTVTDARGGIATWIASAGSTTFKSVVVANTSTSSAVTYTPGTVSTTGTAGTSTVAAPGSLIDIAAPASVVHTTAVSGNNVASWTPTLHVTMPAGSLADDYTGTVTTSVA